MLDFLATLFDFFWSLFKADEDLAQSSRLGEARDQRESRHSCQRGCLIVSVVLSVLGLVGWLVMRWLWG